MTDETKEEDYNRYSDVLFFQSMLEILRFFPFFFFCGNPKSFVDGWMGDYSLSLIGWFE